MLDSVLTLLFIALLVAAFVLIRRDYRRYNRPSPGTVPGLEAAADPTGSGLRAYLRTVFSNDDCASFARYATLITVLTSVGILVYLVLRNHALPDGTQILALSAWMTAPYAINKATSSLDHRSDSHEP